MGGARLDARGEWPPLDAFELGNADSLAFILKKLHVDSLSQNRS
jgi:hypothetical protein